MKISILEEKLIWDAASDQEKYNSLLRKAKVSLPKLSIILEELATQVLAEHAPYNIKVISKHSLKITGKEGVNFDRREIKITEKDTMFQITSCLIPQLYIISVKEAKNMTSWDYFKKGYAPEQLIKLYAEENITALVKSSQIIYKYFLENQAEMALILAKDASYAQTIENFKKLTIASSYDGYSKEFSALYYQHYQNLYDDYIKNQSTEFNEEAAQEVQAIFRNHNLLKHDGYQAVQINVVETGSEPNYYDCCIVS